MNSALGSWGASSNFRVCERWAMGDISPITYPKPPFLTVLKPQEPGCSLLQRRRVFAPSWLDHGKWERRQRTYVETLRGSQERPQGGQRLALLLMCTQSQWGQTGLSRGRVMAQDKRQHSLCPGSWLSAWGRGSVKGRIKVIYRCRKMAK